MHPVVPEVSPKSGHDVNGKNFFRLWREEIIAAFRSLWKHRLTVILLVASLSPFPMVIWIALALLPFSRDGALVVLVLLSFLYAILWGDVRRCRFCDHILGCVRHSSRVVETLPPDAGNGGHRRFFDDCRRCGVAGCPSRHSRSLSGHSLRTSHRGGSVRYPYDGCGLFWTGDFSVGSDAVLATEKPYGFSRIDRKASVHVRNQP